MGLRDMRTFNQALLEKQAWGFIHNTERQVHLNENLVDTIFTGNTSVVYH